LIIHDGLEVPVLDQAIDPDAVNRYTYLLRPDAWAANTVYYTGRSVVVPSQPNGFYYLADSGGRSDAVEPTWPCRKGQKVEDGCVVWKALPYDFLLPPDRAIAAAAWSADDPSVVISDIQTSDNKTSALIGSVPAGLEQVRIKIHFTYAGSSEEDDRSFIIPVRSL